MSEALPPADRLLVIGSGRVALALGLLLHRTGAVSSLRYVGRRPDPPDHPLFSDPTPGAAYTAGLSAIPAGVTGVVIAVPDGAIGGVAARLTELGLADVPVVHTSGSHGVEVLAPLHGRTSLGGVHPLAAIADGVEGADRLRGATFAVEGDGDARALAERIVAGCAGKALPIASGRKALYHAAAVFASNYAVTVLAVAERLMESAGFAPAEVRPALVELAAGAVQNVGVLGPVAALTGPIARGDDTTVALHLSRLSGDDRPLYSLLGREALRLAREAGLDAEASARVGRLFGEDG